MRWIRRTAVIIISLMVITVCFFIILRIKTQSFLNTARREFQIPAVGEGFVPQGFFYDEESEEYLVSGYMTRKRPSRIYIVSRDDGGIFKGVTLRNKDGSDFTGHAGGICAWGRYIYIAGTWDGLYVFDRSEIMDAKNGDIVSTIGVLPIKVKGEPIRASFVTVHDDMLTVGECHVPVILSTPESHHFQRTGGRLTKALALNYRMNEERGFGVDLRPTSVYTLPEMVQGICFDDGEVIVSSSDSVISSSLYVYEDPLADPSGKVKPTSSFEGISVYPLDENCQKRVIVSLPFSEGVSRIDGRIYSIYEAASNIWHIGKLFEGDYCYSVP